MSVFGPAVALIIVDMVNDFVSQNGSMYVPGIEVIITGIKQLSDEARNAESPVIYICDSQEDSEAESGTWPRYTEDRKSGTEIIPQLKPSPSDFVVRKHQYSTPFGADLDLLLRELGVTKLVLTGTAMDVCIYFIAQDAHTRGYQIVVPENCVVALSESDKKDSLKQMEQLFDAEII